MGAKSTKVYKVEDMKTTRTYDLCNIVSGKIPAAPEVILEARRMLVLIYNNSDEFARVLIEPALQRFQAPRGRPSNSTADTDTN